MSRKHWSDVFLIAAAVCLILVGVLPRQVRLVALVAFPLCMAAGTLARRRMV
jgi:hypothetical protein